MKVRMPMFVAALFVTSSIVAAESPNQNTSASDPSVFRLLPNYFTPENSPSGNRPIEDAVSSAELVARPNVMSALRLTETQKSQIASLFEAHANEVSKLTADLRTVAGEVFLQRLDELSNRRDVEILNVLNNTQRIALDDIVEGIRQKDKLGRPAPQVPKERLKEIRRIA